jgi:hypothetical protein
MLFGRPSRDVDMLHDVALIGATVPHGEVVGSPESLWNEWNLQSYLLRYHAISMDSGPTLHAWRNGPGTGDPPGYEHVPIATRSYGLWRRIELTPGAGQ